MQSLPISELAILRGGPGAPQLGISFDAAQLSDEYSREGSFTGTFIGMCAQDLSGTRKPADFDYFEYISRA